MQLENGCKKGSRKLSKYEKARQRILLKPMDYTYTEAKNLLSQMKMVELMI